MSQERILILGNHARRHLIDTLSGLGFEPQVRGSMRAALEKLQHGGFAAVLIDRKFAHTDALEFVLNARDIDKLIPVVVIGCADDQRVDRRILEQSPAIVLSGDGDPSALARQVAGALCQYHDTGIGR